MTDDLLIDEGGRLASPEELQEITEQIEAWFSVMAEHHPLLAEVTRLPGDTPRWFVRLVGETRDASTIRFELGQRTLRFECGLLPPVEEHVAEVYEHLLRRNDRLYGMAFALDAEGSVVLVGKVALSYLDAAVLDRIVGSVWTCVEQTFRPVLRLAFASRLGAP